MDNFSKHLWAFPLKTATSRAVIQILENHIFLPYSVPRVLIMDNGKQFVSQEFRSFLTSYGIQDLRYNAFFHPQHNVSERYNQTVVTLLAMMVQENQRDWCTYLPKICSCINSTMNIATGHTPHLLMFGFENVPHASFYRTLQVNQSSSDCTDPLEQRLNDISHLEKFYDTVSQTLVKAFHKNAARYNLRRRDICLEVGQVVWRRSFTQSDAGKYYSKKLAPRFIKCIVVRRLSRTVFELKDFAGSYVGKFHTKDIIKI
jgi:hypothetical protein